MKRARVKTKTGCSTCRSRRKKCDEVKPTCGACSRLKLYCDWVYVSRSEQQRDPLPSLQSVLARSIEHEPSSGNRATRSCDRQAEEDSDHSQDTVQETSSVVQALYSMSETPSPDMMRPSEPHLIYTDKRYHPRFILPSYLTTFVTPLAKEEYRNWNPWLGIIMSQPWTRDAIMAFGASWLSSGDESLVLPCHKFYASAIAGLRSHLEGKRAACNVETGLIASYFLGLFETFWSKHTVEPMYHFSAVARMLALQRRGKGYRNPAMQRICTIIVETMLYNITNNAMFSKDLESEMHTWKEVELSFKSTDDSKEPQWRTSPLLAGRREAFTLAWEILWLCRQDLSDPSIKEKIRQSERGHRRLVDETLTYYPPTLSRAMLRRYLSRHSIVINASKVILMKLANPKLCCADPEIQETTQATIDALRSQYTTRTRLMSDGLSWPLCTMLCAVDMKKDFEAVSALAMEFIPIMANGVQHRMREALRLISARRNRITTSCQLVYQETCDGKHGCLDLLTKANGILLGAET